MSSEDAGCTSRSYQNDELATCELEAPHSSVHVGSVGSHYGSGIRERVQWTDADAISDTEGVDGQVPAWYAALPLGETVSIDARGGGWANVLLDGAVLNTDDTLAAVRVSYFAGDEPSGMPQRVLVPWHAVTAIRWEDS